MCQRFLQLLVRVVLLKCLAANLMLGLVPMHDHKPEIVVVAFAEHAGGGGKVAAQWC